MERRRVLRDVLGLIAVCVAQRALAAASDYPSRPIKVIVPYAPGSMG